MCNKFTESLHFNVSVMIAQKIVGGKNKLVIAVCCIGFLISCLWKVITVLRNAFSQLLISLEVSATSFSYNFCLKSHLANHISRQIVHRKGYVFESFQQRKPL